MTTMKVSKSLPDKSAPEMGIDKSNKDEVDLDIEGFDLGLSNDYITLPNES
ncbi:MAG: hypothetical protein Q8K42_09600 [Methylobacter sp.]|nr:hypothetical protein [Methylobacter sp.]